MIRVPAPGCDVTRVATDHGNTFACRPAPAVVGVGLHARRVEADAVIGHLQDAQILRRVAAS